MLARTHQSITAKLASDEGATATEYAIMAALIATVIILAVTAIGSRLSALFAGAATAF